MNHKEFLFKILDILEENNIEYVLFAGTLLGCVRDNNFLPSDHKDTDIALDDKYYWDVRKLFDKLVKKGQFKWLAIWRKELSIMSLDDKIKVDMFFMEKENDKYLVYAYKKNNIDGVWDWEWRAKFTASAFFPAIKYKFFNRNVYIPNNYNQVLTEEYGDWKIPDPSWISSDNTVLNADKEYPGFSSAQILNPGNYITNNSDIAIIMTNLYRPTITKRSILSIKKHAPNVKIYIIDQDFPTETMINFYETNNVQYYFINKDIGLGYARNFLLEQSSEKYFMIVDNDVIFTEDTKLNVLFEILKSNKSIGVVAGSLSGTDDYVRRLVFDKTHKKLYYVNLPFHWFYTKKNKYSYCYSDLVLNFFLAKKEVWHDCKWDNDLKVGEHTSYFLRLKKTNWKITFTPLVRAIHESERNDNYSKYRFRGKHYLNLFMKKIGLNNIKDIIQINDSSNEIEENCMIIDDYNDKKIFYIFELLKQNKIPIVLLLRSCLDAVKYKRFKDNHSKLFLGIGLKDYEYLKLLLTENTKKIDDNNYQLDNLNINISRYEYPLKSFDIYQYQIFVPCPVIKYLNNLYGKNWKDS